MGDTPKKREVKSIKTVLLDYLVQAENKYVTKEFQDFGNRLAAELDDTKNMGMYMRLAKTVDRGILESALSFVKDARGAKSKARLFLWKMKKLKTALKSEKEITYGDQ